MQTLWRGALVALALILLTTPQPLRAQGGQRPPTPVTVADVRTETLDIETTAVGSLLSNEAVMIRPEIEGRIVEIGFEEGEPVEKGQQLFKLDDTIYEAELADAEARLDLAERNYERAKELFQKGAGTARGRDEARSDYQIAEAAVHLARARLAKTTIEAPFAGVAGLRRVSVGDYLTAGHDLVNLEDIEPLKVEFAIPERYLGSLRTGQRVQLTADAFPGRSFEGEIYAIDPKIDPAGRSLQVRARVPNDDGRLRPGLFARVKVRLGTRENAILIPEQAIVPRGRDRFVFKVVDGKAVEVKVEIGQRRFGTVEIVDGLAAGDRVVTAGQLKIRDGAPVAPVNAGGRSDGASDASEQGS